MWINDTLLPTGYPHVYNFAVSSIFRVIHILTGPTNAFNIFIYNKYNNKEPINENSH